jgi:hypothetical protein
MAMNAERNRALRLLAAAPNGATEAIMLAHGFTNAMLDALVREGLATAEQLEMRAGRRRIELTLSHAVTNFVDRSSPTRQRQSH